MRRTWKESCFDLVKKSYYKRQITIPLRKQRILNFYGPHRLLFFEINHNCDSAIIVHGNAFKDELIIEYPTKRYPNGEKFYNIPFTNGKPVHLR